MPRMDTVDPAKGLLVVEWPLFGELSRALALKVAREYDPEVVVGVATAGVVPGAVVAAILDRPFASITVSRRFRATTVRASPAIIGAAPRPGLACGGAPRAAAPPGPAPVDGASGRGRGATRAR